MKELAVCDISLKELSGNGKEMPLVEKRALVTRLASVGVSAIELPPMHGTKEESVTAKTLIFSAPETEFRIPIGMTEEEAKIAGECAAIAKNACLQVVFPVSTVQMEYTYHLKAPKAVQTVAELVKRAGSLCGKVEFIAADATRASSAFLKEICKTAVENGASIVTLTDEAGIALPDDVRELILSVRDCGADVIGFSASNALHLATANASAAIRAGAGEIKTIAVQGNGTKLDSLCDLISAKRDAFDLSFPIDLTAVHQKLREEKTVSSPFAEKKNGVSFRADTTFSELSDMLSALGYELNEQDIGKVFDELVRVAGHKTEIGAKEIEAIVANTTVQVPSTYHLESYVINSGNIIAGTAQIVLSKNGEKCSAVGQGDGPIDAAFNTIEQIIGYHYELEEFRIDALTEGKEALGSAIVKLRFDGRLYTGNGISADIVGASIRAYVNALNKIVYEEG